MANQIVVTKENGKFIKVTVNGKPVQKSQINALNKAQEETSYWCELPEGEYTGTNPISGVRVPLTAFEATVYSWLLVWYGRYLSGKMDVPNATYDAMKYLFLALNSEAYYDLID